jgi:predicted PurR-regulated permease PerM
LLAFIISPVVTSVVDVIPRLPRILATVLVYTAMVVIFIFLILVVAQALSNSITQFAASLPDIRGNMVTIVAPLQAWLGSIGLGQVDLAGQGLVVLDNLDEFAGELIVPLQAIAVASIGAVGTMLIVFILSIYMVIDRDQIMAFLFRLVPPAYAEEARLLQTSVARSFGGFLRGQAFMGIVYFGVALLTHAVLGLELAALSATSAGVLMAIPFFGPFLAWAPPVLVALFTKPEVLLPAVLMMGAGWLVVMNALQPRIMQGAVGIHPIVVLGSVLIGSKIAGIAGAIFGIPVAAVVSSFFFHFLHRSAGDRSVAGRAAKRLSEREGRPVQIPREPAPGQAADVPEP